MRKTTRFMGFYSVLLFTPLVSLVTGFLTPKQMGLALPKPIDFLASLGLGLFFIPVLYKTSLYIPFHLVIVVTPPLAALALTNPFKET